MVVPSGIVLPGDQPLPVREVVRGLYIVEKTHERDLGFFSESLLYARELAIPEKARPGQARLPGPPEGETSS
jgi:hypothetical protein